VKRRWKLAIVAGAALAVLFAPIVWVEVSCNGAPAGWAANAPYASVQPGDAGKRPEARSWLTYPEWYIVYSAESYGAWLAQGKAPSGYGYGRQIAGFWSGMCAVNRAAAGKEAGDAKMMLYTIGLSFTVETAARGFYENVFGRITEWLGGWKSENDAYNAKVWQEYGTFMHETPWYKFPFWERMKGFWGTSSARSGYRNWERRLALSTEYAVKSGYGASIGVASDAALDGAAPTLSFVARGTPGQIAAVDPRLKPGAVLPGGLSMVEAPRYAQFTDLLTRLSRTQVELVEIAGNDDVLVALLVPDAQMAAFGTPILSMPLDEKPGWRRIGLAVKVPQLLALLRDAPAGGGQIEHVYDY
jgi:hypothetical protein